MTVKFRCALLALVLAAIALSAVSCGHSQQLVGISIEPGVETFGAPNIPVIADAGLSVQLRALGQYIHPIVTKDITDQATWSSNTPGMVVVDSTGMITATGGACGGTLISATVQTNHSSGDIQSSGAIVTATMQANVVCFTGTGGGGSGPTLNVAFPGLGSGVVQSNPAGISCAGAPCSATFPSGSVVNITATANSGSTFAGWNNCDSTSGAQNQICIINSLTADRTVSVLFN